MSDSSSVSINERQGRVFLVETLDLVASYLHGQSVELDVLDLGRTLETGDTNLEQLRFRQELEARHALACAQSLRPLIASIEREPSATTTIVDAQSKGDIIGRLNVPRYLAQRSYTPSTPRTYPVLINQHTPNTPENALVVVALHCLATQMGRAPFPRSTAEGLQCSILRGWARSRIRRSPWSDVTRTDAIWRLRSETYNRVRKRQTGNEEAYAQLLSWTDEWLLDVSRLGAVGTREVIEGLLAFPPGDFFFDRVFEIWCLKQVADSLSRCGSEAISGPIAMSDTSSAIYRFLWKGRELQIWFQRQHPIGSPHWFYVDNSRSLTGIPDIVVTDGHSPPLLIDAKFRFTDKHTRSEETYKMLGYAQNFHETLGGRLEGLLIFIGPNTFHRVLESNSGDRLDLLVVNQIHTNEIQTPLDQRIAAWLGSLKN